eukprot:CAMPEP_0168834304 /NCGR_PEP_ID=MMETSP0727-20121128/3514_1 /TAXON_ID=265536 /ORGANISM="Amphiprora sp., Strain CCMP467" /LENGTH=701 /DNA_ID=CAMNT_0008887635 /DNA_START=14 /DNA_END=2119 /DNA_ORIENTATION=+
MALRERFAVLLLVGIWLFCCLTLLKVPQLLGKPTASSQNLSDDVNALSLRRRGRINAIPQVVITREDSETLISTVSERGVIDVDVGTWTNQHNIVHVIHTRFLQNGQFEMDSLAKASYDILRTFTLPSIKQQTNPQFLWIIWTDSNFRGPIAKQLIQEVKQVPNTVLLGLNDDDYQDEMLDHKVERDFRSLHGIALNNLPDILLAGQRNLLLDYYTASQRRLLVETRLETGDALSRNFVESVQSHAASTVSRSNNPKQLEVFCPEDHMEWQYYRNNRVVTAHHGQLLQYHNNYCLHSGRSVVYNHQATARQLQQVLSASMELKSQRRRAKDNTDDSSMTVSEMETLEECPEGEVKPPEEICEQRGTLVRKHDPQDLHRSGTCPAGSFFCKGSLKSVFGGPRFAPPQEFVECQVEGTAQSIVVSVKVSHMSRDGKEQTGVQMTMDAKVSYMMAAVYVKGGPGGHLYKWDWPENGGVGGTRSGTFQSPNENPIGHIDLCVIPTRTLCEVADGNAPGPNVTTARQAKVVQQKESPKDECRRKLRMVYDETQEDNSLDTNYIRNAVLISQAPADASMKEIIPENYRNSPGHMRVQPDAFGAAETAQAIAWRVLEHDFGIRPESVFGFRRRMDENLVAVLEDAIKTPCFGVSANCHEGHTRRNLESLLVKARARSQAKRKGGSTRGLKNSRQGNNDLKFLDKRKVV